MDASQIIRRVDQMRTKRSQIEQVWRKCYEVTYPLRGVGFSTYGSDPSYALGNANQKQAELFDTTATNSVRLLASALLGGLTPANSQWFDLDLYTGTKEEKQWLQEAADLVFQNIHASNYSGQAFECLIDSVIAGTFVMFVEEGKDQPFRFEQWPLDQCYFASSRPGGPIDIVARRYRLTCTQALSAYGDACCDAIKKRYDKTPDDTFEFVQFIEPDTGGNSLRLPIASTHVDVTGKKIVRESGYVAMPAIVPRLLCIPDSPYAQGLVYDALPTIRTLNKLTEIMLGTGDMAMAGMWGVVDDGILNPKTVKIGPRRLITVANRDSIFPLVPGSNFQVGQWMIENLQSQVRKALLSDDLINKNGNSYMTATEVNARVAQVRQMLGPNYERFQSEFLQPLVYRCFMIMWDKQIFAPPPPTLLSKIMQVKYSTPLAKAQKAEDVGAMGQFEMILAQEAQVKPEVLDIYDWDGAARKKADLMGIPVSLVKKPELVAAERNQRNQAMQQQQAVQQQHEIALKNAGKQGPNEDLMLGGSLI